VFRWICGTRANFDEIESFVLARGQRHLSPQGRGRIALARSGELPAGQIADHFKTTRQAISQHLKLLTNVGLLELRRDGTKRLYRVHQEGFGELRTFLEIFWTDRLSLLKRQVEKEKGVRRGER
jgi:DNA-binding transcriptional ArsR family regulator